MSYNSGIDQRFREVEFFSNTTAEDQPLTATNLSLIANLRYVQNWLSSKIVNYLPALNPNFQGTLTSSSGGNISITGFLSVPTITGNPNFTGQPTIQGNPIAVTKIGEIKMFISLASPTNFLKCDGSLYSTTQYQQLFNIIGYSYGGSGASFAVPNFTSVFPIGGNGSNSAGVATSNFVSGNNQSGATNTYSVSSNFGGATTAVPPLFTQVPAHSHNINDPGHTHQSLIIAAPVLGTAAVPPLPEFITQNDLSINYYTAYSQTGIEILSAGSGIQSSNDPSSNLYGVNVSPPYVAVIYYICYN
jgi:microcystin-dependent protein